MPKTEKMPERRIDLTETVSRQTNKKLALVSHILIIDESGSMQSCVKATIEGINTQIATIKESEATAKIENLITLVVFNDQHEFVVKGASPDDVETLTAEKYAPTGNTALYDTIVSVIKSTEADITAGSKVLLSIFTDGMNNICKKYNASDAAREIERVQQVGWTVTYVGANQDVGDVASSLNIPLGNAMSYTSTNEGATRAFAAYARSSTSYCTAISTDQLDETRGVSQSFFSKEAKVKDVSSTTSLPDLLKSQRSNKT